MRLYVFALAALGLVLGDADQAMADSVYSNGPINGTTQAYGIGAGSFVSDSFTVTAPATLSGAQHVGIWVLAGATPLTVDWRIGTTEYGSDISSGTSASLTATFFDSADSGFYDVYDSAFALHGTVTSGQTYWLTLTNATATNDSAIYWDANGGPSASSVSISESFQVTAGTAAAPEPTTLTLLGIGIAGLAGYSWRRIPKRHESYLTRRIAAHKVGP